MPDQLASLSCFLVPCNRATVALIRKLSHPPFQHPVHFVIISITSCFTAVAWVAHFLFPCVSSSSMLFCDETCVRTGRLRQDLSEGPYFCLCFVLVPEDAFC